MRRKARVSHGRGAEEEAGEDEEQARGGCAEMPSARPGSVPDPKNLRILTHLE
jgi:hypothetical protein